MDEHRHIGAKQSRGNKRTTHDNGDLHHCEHPPLRDARHGRSLVGITKCGKADGGVLTRSGGCLGIEPEREGDPR